MKNNNFSLILWRDSTSLKQCKLYVDNESMLRIKLCNTFYIYNAINHEQLFNFNLMVLPISNCTWYKKPWTIKGRSILSSKKLQSTSFQVSWLHSVDSTKRMAAKWQVIFSENNEETINITQLFFFFLFSFFLGLGSMYVDLNYKATSCYIVQLLNARPQASSGGHYNKSIMTHNVESH
jgi:hypothetical protein